MREVEFQLKLELMSQSHCTTQNLHKLPQIFLLLFRRPYICSAAAASDAELRSDASACTLLSAGSEILCFQALQSFRNTTHLLCGCRLRRRAQVRHLRLHAAERRLIHQAGPQLRQSVAVLPAKDTESRRVSAMLPL